MRRNFPTDYFTKDKDFLFTTMRMCSIEMTDNTYD